jgi:hypothetical protein
VNALARTGFAAAPVPATATEIAVFGPRVGGGQFPARLMSLIDVAFLAEIGWDAVTMVMSPEPGHLLLGRPLCQGPGCVSTASTRDRICLWCRAQLRKQGLDPQDISRLAARPAQEWDLALCRVRCCARESASVRHGLCVQHMRQRDRLRASTEELLTHPQTEALTACGPCAVAACARQLRHRDGTYCHVHQMRLLALRRSDQHVDETHWRETEPPVAHAGRVSLKALPDLVVVQVLFGVQQRCRVDQVKSKDSDLRIVCEQLRRQQVRTVSDLVLNPGIDGRISALANALATHARRGLASVETEVLTDEWDLTVFGHSGTVSFTGITQRWLRESTKRWAADDLPRRRVVTGRRTTIGMSVRHYVTAVARLSQTLRMRTDRGEIPAALGRADVESFLHRLAFQEAGGQISTDARIRACREVRGVLARIRAMGLTRPGGAAAGLGDDFTLGMNDIPEEPEAGQAGRDLPIHLMRQICEHLGEVTSTEMRTGFEIAIDTGRRPEEVAALAFDCLARENDGLPVLVYDNHKANRRARRLPISEHTAARIIAQQQRVRARFPHTPIADLKLLPTDRRNPDGTRSVTAFTLSFNHRAWIDRLPMLLTEDGLEFDRAKIFLYAYRHTYAQRHADAGVPIDVLRDLMDHRKLDTTKGYYQVGDGRRREAVDRVAALQFDRHGNHVWRAAQALLDSERARRAVGEVIVPFGVCSEPSNVKAGGGACPYRFRCAGCDHFRTDVSYLPDLTAHLEDLLRNRERLLASTDVDDWVKTDAMPSTEEITRIRRLISRVSDGLDQLDDTDRAQIDNAIATIRRHRAVTLGMPRIRQPLPDLHQEATS